MIANINNRCKGKQISTMALILIIAQSIMNAYAQEAHCVRYDLIAKVIIRSIDATRAIQYIDTHETQAFGYPVEMDLVETICMPDNIGDYRVLMQGYGYHNEVKIASADSFIEAFHKTNAMAIGGLQYLDKNIMVIVSVLSDQEWEHYLKGAEEMGSAKIKDSAEDSSQEPNERIRALEQRIMLRGQLSRGEITEEEYHQKTESLEKLLKRPDIINTL